MYMLMKEKATRGDAGGRSCVAAARSFPMTVGASSLFLIVASGTAEPAGRREYATPGIPSIHRNGVEEVPESATFASLVRQAGALPQGLGSGVADVDDFGDLDPELAAMLHQETLRAGEFIRLTWQDSNRQTFVREISAWEFQRLSKICLVDIYH
jgi:hypothetical protein